MTEINGLFLAVQFLTAGMLSDMSLATIKGISACGGWDSEMLPY